MRRTPKRMGITYEWEMKRIVQDTISEFFVWHIGGSTPGWDNLIIKTSTGPGVWYPFMPIECKSFTEARKNYKQQVIDQYDRYMDIYKNWNILTFYALRHKRLGNEHSIIDRWRILPCTEVLRETGKKGGTYLDYNWDEAMPLKRFLRALTKKPTRSDIKQWPWIVMFK